MIYVMSDIHGMYDKYIKMLETIDLSPKDTLYILGDIVDRGPASMRILKDMMGRSNIKPIFGNHELMMIECIEWIAKEITDELLNDIDENKLIKLSDWLENGGCQTIREFKTLTRNEQRAIIDFLMDFTAYEEVSVNGKVYLFIHAGLSAFDKDKSLDEYDADDFVWESPDFEMPYFDDTDQYVIVGHTPTPLLSGKTQIFHKNNFIAIDCGACFENGMLACLCLDTMEEFYV